MNVVAPHLVHRLPFLFPLYEDGPYRPWFVQSGVLALLDARAGAAERPVELERALQLVPAAAHRAAALVRALRGRVDERRPADARERRAPPPSAARPCSTTRRSSAIRADGADVARRRARRSRCSAKAVVNATGPWVDRVRRLEDPTRGASIRLSKGVHVVVDGGDDWSAALTIPHDKVRVSFAVPWEGMLLLGTTDTLHDGEPDDGAVTDDDVRTGPRRGVDRGRRPRRRARALVLRAARPARRRRRDGERAARDGLHARPDRDAQRRRRQADDVPADRARRARPARRRGTLDRQRRGRCPARRASTAIAWPGRARRRRRAATCCTSTARSRRRCSRPAADDPSLLEPLVPGRPDLRAQELYARTHEWAVTDEDVLRRRTTAWLRGDRVAEHAATP